MIASGSPLRTKSTRRDAEILAQVAGRHLHRARATARFPGAGCGKAVERAVWKATLPSTFCIT